MKNPFTNTSSNLSNIFHNNIHRKKGESLKVRSTKKFFPGSAAGAAALKYYLHVQAKSLDRLGFWFCFIPSLGSWLSKLPSWTACQCPPGSPGSWSVELGVYRTRFIMGLLYYIITNPPTPLWR